MYKFHFTITVSDTATGHQKVRTVVMELDKIDREMIKAFGVKVSDEASLAAWDAATHDARVDPIAEAAHNMARERTRRVRGRGSVPPGHGGES